MTRIEAIKGIELDDVRRLSQHHIETLDDLWRNIGADFNQGLERVAATTGVACDLLLALVVADSLKGVRQSAAPRTNWYYPEVIWIVPKWVWLRFKLFWLSRTLWWPDLVLIIAAVALVTAAIRVWSRVGSLEGHYMKTSLPVGSSSRSDQLIPVELAGRLQGRQVLSVPVKTGTLIPNLTPPTDVWLLLSTRQPSDKAPQSTVIKNVILLSVEREGESSSVIVAVEETDLEQLKPLLGVADLFVLRPAP